jgi:hypothetical protein
MRSAVGGRRSAAAIGFRLRAGRRLAWHDLAVPIPLSLSLGLVCPRNNAHAPHAEFLDTFNGRAPAAGPRNAPAENDFALTQSSELHLKSKRMHGDMHQKS